MPPASAIGRAGRRLSTASLPPDSRRRSSWAWNPPSGGIGRGAGAGIGAGGAAASGTGSAGPVPFVAGMSVPASSLGVASAALSGAGTGAPTYLRRRGRSSACCASAPSGSSVGDASSEYASP